MGPRLEPTAMGLDDSIAAPATPCSTRYLDVKATDHEAPLLWGLIPFSPSPKTNARVEIRQVDQLWSWAAPFWVLELRRAG